MTKDTIIDKKEIIIIFLDSRENYQLRLGKLIIPRLFHDVVCFETTEELKNYFQSKSDSDEYFLLFIHAWRNQKEYSSELKSKINVIKTDISSEIIIRIVTTDQAHKIKEAIRNSDPCTYDEIIEKSGNNYRPQKFKDIFSVTMDEKKENKMDNFIFISHSTHNAKIVENFVEKLLVLGLNVPKGNIFCTSYYSTSLKVGDDIPLELKKALNKMTLFIQFISDEYKKSEICLNEMGAAWAKLDSKSIISCIIPPLSFDKMGFININKLGIKINDKLALRRIFDDYKVIFGSYSPQTGQYNIQIDKFIRSISKIKKS